VYSRLDVANLPEASAGTRGTVGHEEILFVLCLLGRRARHAVSTVKRLGETVKQVPNTI
jgi:hypothetical protein